MGHDGVMSSNSHHSMLLILNSTRISTLDLTLSLRGGELTVRKHLSVICTSWDHMCNLWFVSRIHAHLLLLSSTLSSNTMIGLLMTVLCLVLMIERLAVYCIWIRVRVVTVTLSGICILGENRLLVRLLLYLLIIRIHRTLKRSETCGTALHWLS